MSRETTARMVESRLRERRSGMNPTLGDNWSGEGASWEGAAGRLGTSTAQWDEVRSKKRRDLRRMEEGQLKKRVNRSRAAREAKKAQRKEEEVAKRQSRGAASGSGRREAVGGRLPESKATPRMEQKRTPTMNLQKEVERNEAPAKKKTRTMYSGVPLNQQQQRQPSQGQIDYKAMMRKKEAELSRYKKGSNAHKVALGRIRTECGRMAAEARKRAIEEREKGEVDMRPVLQEKKMMKRIEIEERKREEDENVALDRRREEDAKNERIKKNLERIMKVVGEENEGAEERREKEIMEMRRCRDEREERMRIRRAKEDGETGTI